MNEKIIYTRWLAQELIRQGFPVVRIERNPIKPEFYCWVFAETDEFITAFANTANKAR